jgi:tetratricopeptide (TPR) repeat protein
VSRRTWLFGTLLLLQMLLSVALLLPRPAAAEPVKGSVSAVVENGFARLIFMLGNDVESQVRVANNIVVISFDQPVDINVDRVRQGTGDYIGAARRDPDGKAVRIALAPRVTMNSMVAGDRLYVDLLPDSWSGLPPGLPREVIEELARRARDAEKKLRQEHPAEDRKIPLVRVRVASQPTFTRYMFPLPEPTSVAADNRKDKLTLTFNGMLNFDLADAKAVLPPTLQSVDSELDQDTAVVRFTYRGKVDVRTFRDDNSYVVDISSAEVKDGRPLDGKPIDELASLAADLVAKKTPPPADLEAPQTVPAKAAPDAAEPKRAPAPVPARESAPPAPAAAAAPSEKSVPVTPPERPATTEKSMPAAPTDKDMRAVAPTPFLTPMPPVAAVPAGAGYAAPPPAVMPAADPPGADQAAALPPPAVPKPPAVQPAPEFAAQPAPEPPAAQPPPEPSVAPPPAPEPPVQAGTAVAADPNSTIKVLLKMQGENLTLRFPFASPTPAAVFRRADTLWFVFDTDADIRLAELANDPSHNIKNASVTRLPDAAVVRIKLERPKLTSVAMEGATWVVTIGSQITAPTQALTIIRNGATPAQATATVMIADAHQVHRIQDPEAGDTLLIVTALAPARGFINGQEFVEFRMLASALGVVVQPLADDIGIELSPDRLTLSRPTGLTLSSLSLTGLGVQASADDHPNVINPDLWTFDRKDEFNKRESQLLFSAAKSSETQRLAARVDLARFYLAWERSAEAKGVLDVALKDNPPSAGDPIPLVLRAVANIMLGRPQEALKDLANPIVGNQFDAPLWRAWAYSRLARWADASDGFRDIDSRISRLPVELQRKVLREVIRVSIAVGDVTGAVNAMHEFEILGVPRELRPIIAVYNGEVAERLGRVQDALQSYQVAADSTDRRASAQGQLREINLANSLGKLPRTTAIGNLETLTAIWRGDEIEIEALKLLAHLYTEEGRYRDSFHVMRIALTAYPNSELTRGIQDEAAETFENIFLAGSGDALSAIDALALFYDFRDLTPIGRRGDEMIRRLADRLVAVDLLDQAAELLQYQVDHRLQGAARSQVAMRLAMIYLMNHKADDAFATLRATRVEDVSKEMRQQRLLLESRALSDLGRYDVALEIIANIAAPEASRLRADILWSAHRWSDAAEQIELIYGDRWMEFTPLNDAERSDVMRAAAGYALGDDLLGLARFRERYAGKMGEGPDRRAFDVITEPVDASGADFRAVAHSVAAVDTLSSFLRDMRARYPDTGPLPPQVAPPKTSALPPNAAPAMPAAPGTTGSTPPPRLPPPRLGRTAAR